MWLDRNPPDDEAAEADEIDQNTGEKGLAAHRSGRPAPTAGQAPPGTWDLRRRPSPDRRSRRASVWCVRLGGTRSRRGDEREQVIESTTLDGTIVDADEWKGHGDLPRIQRGRPEGESFGAEVDPGSRRRWAWRA